jgi:hypothetical protein
MCIYVYIYIYIYTYIYKIGNAFVLVWRIGDEETLLATSNRMQTNSSFLKLAPVALLNNHSGIVRSATNGDIRKSESQMNIGIYIYVYIIDIYTCINVCIDVCRDVYRHTYDRYIYIYI